MNCHRSEETVTITVHHCIPQQKGGKKGPVMDLCKDCHGQIHALYDHAHLKLLLNTPELVVADDAMRRFGTFAGKVRSGIKKRESRDRRAKRRARR